MTVLVTGATGLVGRSLLDQLRTAGVPVRALSRHPGVAGLPADVPVTTGDLGRPESVTAALDGVDALYLFAASYAGPELAQTLCAAGVQQVVVLSGLGDRDPAAVEHWAQDAGLAWTHLRPAAFASNALAWWSQTIQDQRTVRAPYGDAATAPIHEADIAAVACTALSDAGHAGQRYLLTGPESLTYRQQVQLIGRAIGQEITFVEETPEQARDRMTSDGLPAAVADRLLTVWAAAVGRAASVEPTVETVTGRPAHTFAQWAREHVEDFR